jgi:hypothetical protein
VGGDGADAASAEDEDSCSGCGGHDCIIIMVGGCCGFLGKPMPLFYAIRQLVQCAASAGLLTNRVILMMLDKKRLHVGERCPISLLEYKILLCLTVLLIEDQVHYICP